MAIWDRNKVAPASLNSGNEYAAGDQPTQATFNDANNNGFYSVDYTEALADAPDNTDVGTVGTPAVSLVDNVKVIDGVSKTFKKFKFSQLKGEKGDAGINDAIVVQIEGTSVENVISQKGVTDKLVSMRSFPTAGGTGTAITVTTGHFELVSGRSFTFIASANNSGSATTMNADGTGVKNLYKPGTTTAPTIISGKAYTVWYNGTSFFLKANAEGDAVVGDVLKNKVFSNDADTGLIGTLELTGSAAVGDVLATKTFYNTDAQSEQTGTMTNNGTVSTDISAKAAEVTIAQGYHSGSGKVKISAAEQAKIIEGNIKTSVNMLGVVGTFGDGVAGDTIIANASTSRYFDSTAYKKYKEITVSTKGTYRVVMELGNPSFASTCYGRVYKNGVAYGTERFLNNDTQAQIAEDLVFSAGDKVQFYGRYDEPNSGSCWGFSVRITPTPSPTATVDLD